MSAIIIKPVAVKDAVLISSTVPEADYPAWNAATSYTVGTRVMRAVAGVHKNFENLIAGINATLPELASSPPSPRWLDLGPTNRWAMFDRKVGTVTTGASPMTWVLAPGIASGLGFMGLVGQQLQITARASAGGVVIIDKLIQLDATSFGPHVVDWFFSDFAQLSDLIVSDIPGYYAGMHITITLTSTAGSVSCGVCVVGIVNQIGNAGYDTGISINTYAVETVDSFGNLDVKKGPNSKRNDLRLMIDHADLDRIYKLIASLDAVPVFVSGTDARGYEVLVVYCYLKSLNIAVTYPMVHLMSLEIKGLT